MRYIGKEVSLNELIGKRIKTIKGLEKLSEEVRILTEDGNEYLFYHQQDCCESVSLADFELSAKILEGATIISAEVVTNSSNESEEVYESSDSWTWSFYKIETDKGGLWMRWFGESNGYYSEEVTFVWVNKPKTIKS